MYKIDRFGSSFWAAINTTEGPRALSRLERRRAKVWLDRAHAALDAANVPGTAVRKEVSAPSVSAPNEPSRSGSQANQASVDEVYPGESSRAESSRSEPQPYEQLSNRLN
jgi:hypothetical protein